MKIAYMLQQVGLIAFLQSFKRLRSQLSEENGPRLFEIQKATTGALNILILDVGIFKCMRYEEPQCSRA